MAAVGPLDAQRFIIACSEEELSSRDKEAAQIAWAQDPGPFVRAIQLEPRALKVRAMKAVLTKGTPGPGKLAGGNHSATAL